MISGNAQVGPTGAGLLGISIAFGFAVVAMAYAIGGISGCHINPTVTTGVFAAGRMSGKDAIGYIVAQLIGATLGAGVLYILASGIAGWTMPEWGLGSNGYGEGYLGNYSVASAFVAETVFTCLFLFVLFAVTSKYGNNALAELAIRFTRILLHLIAIPIIGTSVNPARSFRPVIFAGRKVLSQIWLFFVAPLCGAGFAGMLRKYGFETGNK